MQHRQPATTATATANNRTTAICLPPCRTLSGPPTPPSPSTPPSIPLTRLCVDWRVTRPKYQMAGDDTDMPPYTNTVTEYAYALLSINPGSPPTSHLSSRLPLPPCLALPSQPFFLRGVFWSCKLLFYDFIVALFPSSRQLISTSTWTLTIWPSVNPLQCLCVCMSVWGIGESETGENWESHWAVEQEIQCELSTHRK